MPSPHAVYHHVTATCHRSYHVFPVLPPTRPTSSRFATTPTPCHPTDAARALPTRSLLIHSILSRRSIPAPVCVSACTSVAYLARLVTFLLGNGLFYRSISLPLLLLYRKERDQIGVSGPPTSHPIGAIFSLLNTVLPDLQWICELTVITASDSLNAWPPILSPRWRHDPRPTPRVSICLRLRQLSASSLMRWDVESISP